MLVLVFVVILLEDEDDNAHALVSVFDVIIGRIVVVSGNSISIKLQITATTAAIV
jgi:hypothetical protein